MKLIECLIDGYKNLRKVEIYPCSGINVVYGANAQGKTNLIEAISLFSGRDRLRRRDSSSIAFDRDFCKMQIKFNDRERDQIAQATLSRKSKFFLNSVSLKRISEFCGAVKKTEKSGKKEAGRAGYGIGRSKRIRKPLDQVSIQRI